MKGDTKKVAEKTKAKAKTTDDMKSAEAKKSIRTIGQGGADPAFSSRRRRLAARP